MSANSTGDTARMEVLKQLPPMMPLFLRKRRAGLPAVQELAGELAVAPPELFTLLNIRFAAGSYGNGSVTASQIRALDPYAARDLLSRPLAELTRKGLVAEDDAGGLVLSLRALAAVERLHKAGRAHVAAMQPLPSRTLEELASLLQLGRDALLKDSILWNRPGSHLQGAHSHAPFGADAPSMVLIEQAIYDLWMARDDAHIAAWREAGLEGPPMAVLTQVWGGHASTLAQLVENLSPQQSREDVESSLAYLVANEYIEQHDGAVSITPVGALVRDNIERETDRVYFAPWPHTLQQGELLYRNLHDLVSNLPTPPPPSVHSG